ncbi:IPT/TIG domain-containing protein [Phthorimaea operculella]|nr:IPT/TIG domain-containing protein [Phthorimaea operculella]
MGPPPVVTGISPKEGPPGTRVTIRGEFLGTSATDLIGLKICGCDCLLSAEWKSKNKIVARSGPCKGRGDIIVTTRSGGEGTSTVQFRGSHTVLSIFAKFGSDIASKSETDMDSFLPALENL